MKLEMESVRIDAIEQGPATCAENGVLQVDFYELEELILRDRRIKAVDLSLAFPGDPVRIVNLIDIIQPRCKTEPAGADFPGWIGKMQIAGKGKTRSLAGVTVLVSNPNPADKVWKAVLDMDGVLAELSRFGKMRHVSVSPHPAQGVERLDFENAVKKAGLKTAVYLAKAAEDHPPDDTTVYDLDIPISLSNGGLPRVAYYYQLYTPQHDQGGVPDKIFYGGDVINLMPGIIHPNEVLDGGLVGPHTRKAGNTYSIQNHGIIRELYRRHGKDLIFAGVVYGVASLDPVTRSRKAMIASNLIKNVLCADGVIVSKIHGGMPHVDMALVAEECENLGVGTAVFDQPVVGCGTLSDTLLFKSDRLDLIITIGATLERMKVPLKADRFLGGTAETGIPHAEGIEQKAAAPLIDLEEFLAAGVHDQFGDVHVIVREY